MANSSRTTGHTGAGAAVVDRASGRTSGRASGFAPNGVQITSATRTDVGLKRAVNEDSVLAKWPVFLVADGMGGHDAGDRASAAVIAEFRALVGRELQVADVADALDRAHSAVQAIAATAARGAGSTLTGVVQIEHEGQPHWLVLNIGDSRVYRLLGSEFEQLTTDHSLVQEMLDSGTLAPENVHTFGYRNVITRAIGSGGSSDNPADFWLHPVVNGERLLVCSDGLSNELGGNGIGVGLGLGYRAKQTANLLLRRALENGGRDNVSLIVVDVLGGGAEPVLETYGSLDIIGEPASVLGAASNSFASEANCA
ncbi:PP2C family serine/threonine-protein phosphatase [Homoserinimonas sp. OAct 916]|uniref:PP2C family protein-serine/threonine phosphatase n=1 Tax=Homoserinimonas sp. OAct 916 TaxID=2211450 RepID=UPI000DBE2CBE|nr:protein phosphatase 2C domain-containing protein [Homoserinimonas sp. OAct 916]